MGYPAARLSLDIFDHKSNKYLRYNSNTMQNPWLDLPLRAPYVLAGDKLSIDQHRHANNEIRLNTLPEPYIGGLNNAEVIFLALNPGFRESDVTVNLTHPEFATVNRRNQSDPYNSTFYYFDGVFEERGGYWWWKKQLKPLLDAGVTEQDIRNKVMLIEYLPYHSETAGKISNLIVPSQQFTFELVREAIRRNKLIIMMRSEKLWLKAVPELEGKYTMPHNKRNVIISPGNMGQENFDTILYRLTNRGV